MLNVQLYTYTQTNEHSANHISDF